MLSIIGIVAIVVFGIQIYKSAVSTGRNPALWTVAGVLVGIAIQFIIPIIVGIAIGIYIAVTNTPPDDAGFFGVLTIIGIGGIVFSIIGMWLIWKRASMVRDDDGVSPAPPPPPPTFG